MTQGINTKHMKALAHPLRERILTALNRRVASPSELAEELGEPLGNVSYHVRMLVELDCIELVSTTPRRGALEHHYRATARPIFDDDEWSAFPVATRRALMGDTLGQVWRAVGDAADAGAFEDDRVFVARDRMTLDEQAWGEMSDLLMEMFDRASEIRTEAGERLAKAGDGVTPIESELAIMHFRAADSKGAPPKAKGAKPKRRRAPSKR